MEKLNSCVVWNLCSMVTLLPTPQKVPDSIPDSLVGLFIVENYSIVFTDWVLVYFVLFLAVISLIKISALL